jgi:hypothetical protein
MPKISASSKRGVSIAQYANDTQGGASVLSSSARQAELQMEMRTSVLSTIEETQNLRPTKTQSTLNCYQREFMAWCEEKGFADQMTVNGEKLHLFIRQVLMERKSKKRINQPLGFNSIKTSVNAIVALYQEQVSCGMNSNSHPRSNAVKLLLRNEESKKLAKSRANFEDRGKGSLLDGYANSNDFSRISKHFLELDDFRMRCCFAVSHFCLLRGDNLRSLELADMFTQDLEDEGISECRAVVFLMRDGKTKQYGKLQHVGCLRNIDVLRCPIGLLVTCFFQRFHVVGSIALYFFQRFHVFGEPFPDFSSSEGWFGVKLIRGRCVDGSISYETHKKAFRDAFEALNMIFSKITHINRQQGVRELDLKNVDSSQTKRHGLWGTDTCDGVYTNPIAIEAMRAFSGHRY